MVKSGTVSEPVVTENVKAKVENNSPLLTDIEFGILGPEKFETDLTVINKFLNILTIIEKNSNNADATLKSQLDDTLKEKYITKGQQLFEGISSQLCEINNIFCNNYIVIGKYIELYKCLDSFYDNLTNFKYNSLYNLMKSTKNLTDDTEFNDHINTIIKENQKKFVDAIKIIKSCTENIEELRNILDTKGGRKSRKIKHRKTKRRGNGNKKSHKKRNSKSHKKRH